MSRKLKISLIGSGNVASQLGRSLLKSGNEIDSVYSRTLGNAEHLAKELGCLGVDKLDDVCDCSDIYIYAVSDDALPQVIKIIANRVNSKSIHIHTAGSVDMNVFCRYANHYGVIYPLQTLSKNRNIDFNKVPLFVEWSTAEVRDVIMFLAKSISSNVVPCDSAKRKSLHLAAVFACNFANHCFTLAARHLESNGMDYKLLLPLIKETADKVAEMHPSKAQTGPAKRHDTSVINKHIDMLGNELEKEIYKIMSKSIADDKL